MIVYFYKIINLLNKKEYYGVHKTSCVEDNYMGSGVAIKKANKERYSNGYINPIKGTNNYWNDLEKSKIAKEKMSDNHADFNGDKNPFYGKKHKEETIEKLSLKHKKTKKVKCPYCNKIGDISNMTRWHLDNCKKR